MVIYFSFPAMDKQRVSDATSGYSDDIADEQYRLVIQAQLFGDETDGSRFLMMNISLRW
jgi:hypothetical protein